jgi:hypothetical protein
MGGLPATWKTDVLDGPPASAPFVSNGWYRSGLPPGAPKDYSNNAPNGDTRLSAPAATELAHLHFKQPGLAGLINPGLFGGFGGALPPSFPRGVAYGWTPDNSPDSRAGAVILSQVPRLQSQNPVDMKDSDRGDSRTEPPLGHLERRQGGKHSLFQRRTLRWLLKPQS